MMGITVHNKPIREKCCVSKYAQQIYTRDILCITVHTHQNFKGEMLCITVHNKPIREKCCGSQFASNLFGRNVVYHSTLQIFPVEMLCNAVCNKLIREKCCVSHTQQTTGENPWLLVVVNMLLKNEYTVEIL